MIGELHVEDAAWTLAQMKTERKIGFLAALESAGPGERPRSRAVRARGGPSSRSRGRASTA